MVFASHETVTAVMRKLYVCFSANATTNCTYTVADTEAHLPCAIVLHLCGCVQQLKCKYGNNSCCGSQRKYIAANLLWCVQLTLAIQIDQRLCVGVSRRLINISENNLACERWKLLLDPNIFRVTFASISWFGFSCSERLSHCFYVAYHLHCGWTLKKQSRRMFGKVPWKG